MEVRTRFAPSPTGYLHVGGARTALFSFLYAKRHGGKFILRIEDTDLERSERIFEDQLIDDLRWLGIEWDEGPDIGGPYGPYRQSDRLEIYRKFAQKLIDEGKAYEVYTDPEEIEKLREEILSKSQAPHYTREMLEKLSAQKMDEYKKAGKKPAIYFDMPRKEWILPDLVKGEIRFTEDSTGDFAIMRSSGLPTYNFAVVVDDALMKITHVIRGDDHLSNTVKQMALYEAFNFDMPQFGHLSTILGPDRTRLSKRHGSTSVGEYRRRGFLPEALVNYLALLGWSHPQQKEIMSMEEMKSVFNLDRVSKNPAVYDEKKLTWMNGKYIRECPDDKLYELAKPFIVPKLFSEEEYVSSKKWIEKAINALKNDFDELSLLPEKMQIFFVKPVWDKEFLESVKKSGLVIAYKMLLDLYESLDEWSEEKITEATKKAVKESKVKGSEFYHPLRKILTGSESGPDLVQFIFLVGRENIISRLREFLEAL
ncbi:MAG: glutamate--tRNA ligase [Mesoaciditoga sp.]|uniref:glutamate--tRNA ligase n=1 Tax=Athalassotoga sp. TaxID=2022597 RepID=UPI000CC2C18E|nr:MAG: glutamate--tRNA ligase [Mesoaciditoga sp.]HEU24735.1 glutamate--tRNA ligase [Mesoaciditoga lauensis]